MITAHAVRDAYYRARHLGTLLIDKVQKIPRMIKPTGCWKWRYVSIQVYYISKLIRLTVISHPIFVQRVAFSLMRNIGDPDRSNPEAMAL